MSAGKTFDRLWTYGKGQLVVAGSFAPNGGSNPDATVNKGSLIDSVVWTSTGTWTVTLSIAVNAIVAIGAYVQINSAANVDTNIQVGAVTLTAGSKATVVIRNNPGGAVADIAANASNRINIIAVCQVGAVK